MSLNFPSNEAEIEDGGIVEVKPPTVIEAAVDELEDLSPQEILVTVAKRRNDKLAAAELAKKHPLSDFSLDDKQWQQLKDHLFDGGGAMDDGEMLRSLLQAVYNDRQDKFWPALFTLLKSRAKMTGAIIALPNGGISIAKVG